MHAIIRWEGLLRYQHVSEECIGHVVLLRCRASEVCPAFSDASKLNESVAWRLCSPINPFHHCLVNSISFSCLIKKAFTQITEILLLTCVIAYESGGAQFCEVNRTDTLVLVLILVHVPGSSTCVAHPLTCPRPYSPTYQAHMSAYPKRDRGSQLSFSFELHSPLSHQDSTHYSVTT